MIDIDKITSDILKIEASKIAQEIYGQEPLILGPSVYSDVPAYSVYHEVGREQPCLPRCFENALKVRSEEILRCVKEIYERQKGNDQGSSAE